MEEYAKSVGFSAIMLTARRNDENTILDGNQEIFILSDKKGFSTFLPKLFGEGNKFREKIQSYFIGINSKIDRLLC